MSNQIILQEFQDLLSKSISSNQFVKLSIGNYQGNEKDLKNIYVKKVIIKRVAMLSFNYRYKTRDIFKNFQITEGLDLIGHLMSNDFKICTLFTVEKETILEHGKKGAIALREKNLATMLKPDLLHNRVKGRLIRPEGKPYLHELNITDQAGTVYKNAQDKYRQINRYIEILSSLIKELPDGSINSVVDMGSGKGYLTFALYDYLHHVLKVNTSVKGVEFRQDLVELCNTISKQSGFDQLEFVQGSIEDYTIQSLDLLIALHACDTATDDAIFKGVQAGAKLIVVAPCCHKQIRREMERQKIRNDISFLTKYGIFQERQAEMVTDGIRALILEYCGYKTKIFEFISDVHTPKNVLIVGTKGKVTEKRKKDVLSELKDIKSYFGIGYHHLERLMFG
jgi:SAM-dependent methyltransferase